MIDHLRQKVSLAFSATHQVTLSTFGPADIQSSQVECQGYHLHIFLLIPRASEHLINLEQPSTVALVAPGWELRGAGQVLAQEDWPADLELASAPEAAWCALVEVIPARMTLAEAGGASRLETIDF